MALNRMNDRCDACGAQAFTEVGNGQGRLLMCGHHFRKHELQLMAQGWVLLADERDTINEKPMSGHADTPGQEGKP